jgi:DNA-binding Xre family transcriptional regulator
MNKPQNPHLGSSFESFLESEGMAEETEAIALKRVLVWQLQQALEQSQISKTELAKRMHTSRAALNRLLDENNPAVTLSTITKATHALGRQVQLVVV